MITSMDGEALVVQLQKNADAAHAHTAGKAQFYLRRVADKPDARFSNCTADEFVQHVRNAAYRGEWEPLSKVMAGWW